MTQFTETLFVAKHPSHGNGSIKTYGSKRIAATMALATIVVAPSSGAAANDGFGSFPAPKHAISEATLRAVEDRYAELYEIAEEEGIVINRSSYLALKNFVRHWIGARAPAVMLMDDGTMRAIWRDGAEQQVALHFREDGKVQFVVFIRDQFGRMERATGLSSLSGIGRKLSGFGARDLLSDAAIA